MVDLEEKADQLRIELQFASLYHSRRFAFFSNISKLLKVLIILSGTSALTAVATESQFKQIMVNYLPIIVATIATVDLVFSFSDLARQHEFLSRTFLTLNARLEKRSSDLASINEIRAEMIQHFAESPPQLHALARDCRNLIIKRFGLENDVPASSLNWLERRLMHFLSLPRTQTT